jgi:hypothetical protein
MPGATRTFVSLIEQFEWTNDLILDPNERWPRTGATSRNTKPASKDVRPIKCRRTPK